MRVYVHAPREDWICDRLVSEWYQYNSNISTHNPSEADIVWILAEFSWNHLSYEFLKSKKVITSIHHIVPDKFDDRAMQEYASRHSITSMYHVPCRKTAEQLNWAAVAIKNRFNIELPKKPVFVFPYWVNQNIWKSLDVSKEDIRTKFDLPLDKFLVGSFQRDTEGSDLISEKKEKGPSTIANTLIQMKLSQPNIEVVLGGWRRQYIMKRLSEAGIKYHYFERPSIEVVNELYQTLDLYIVGSRYEGGPQAIPEMAALRKPIISTHVGLAPEILHSETLFMPGDWPNIQHAIAMARSEDVLQSNFQRVSKLFLPQGFEPFRRMLGAI